MDELIREIFSHLCHQMPSRSWVVGNELLPLCARCTGVYVVFFLFFFVVLLARFQPTCRILWAHVIAIFQMFLGIFVSEPAWLRMLSGSLFAVGIAYFMWLPLRSCLRSRDDYVSYQYFVAVVAILLIPQILVQSNWYFIHIMLVFFALASIPVMIFFSILNMVFFTYVMVTKRRIR